MPSTDIAAIAADVLQRHDAGITSLPWNLWNPGKGTRDEELIVHGGPCNGTVFRMHAMDEGGIDERNKADFDYAVGAANVVPILAREMNGFLQAIILAEKQLNAKVEVFDRITAALATLRTAIAHHSDIVSAANAVPALARQTQADAKRIAELEAALENIAALPHSNPTGDTLHGPCPKCIAEAALEPKEQPNDQK